MTATLSRFVERRVLAHRFIAVAMILSVGACRNEQRATGGGPSARPSSKPSASAPAPAPAPSAPVTASSSEADEHAALESALERWNRATNEADRSRLESVYAENLNLYERIVKRREAVQRKLDHVAKHPGFSQSLEKASFAASADHRIARFRKTSSSNGVAASSVDAFLVFKQYDGAWLIIDEGDVQTSRKAQARLDTIRKNWKERVWECPLCSDPELGDDPPTAFPPLGPDRVKASAPVPPGAPQTVEYARALFPRFASAVDVPLFLTATPQSTNGDGRWFYYDAPGADAAPAPTSEKPRHLLECAIGGHFSYGDVPANARPDPGHAGDPKVSYTTLFEKRDGLAYYERYIYAADGVMNFVTCTFDPAYEAYFYAMVQRMGRSMRAIAGGQPDRVARESLPYTVE